MRFVVNLKNDKNGKQTEKSLLSRLTDKVRLQLEFAWWGLDSALEDQPMHMVRLVGKSGYHERELAGNGFELELYNPDVKTRMQSLFSSLRRQLAAGGVAFLAMFAFAGTSPVAAQGNNNHPLVRQVTSNEIKSMSPVIQDFDLELLYRDVNDQSKVPVLLARTHTNTTGAHTNTHTDEVVVGHTNSHADTTGTTYHSNVHGDHTNTSHTNTPSWNHTNTVHADGPIWTNTPPQHANYNWENVAHSNVHMHTNASGANINNDYIY